MARLVKDGRLRNGHSPQKAGLIVLFFIKALIVVGIVSEALQHGLLGSPNRKLIKVTIYASGSLESGETHRRRTVFLQHKRKG